MMLLHLQNGLIAVMQELAKTYVMKGVRAPRYYLGGDVLELNE